MTLFDDVPTVDRRHAPEELERVKSSLAAPICRALIRFRKEGGEFRSEQLYEAVRAEVPCAPASVDRILRALRDSGEVSYAVLNRRESLYRVDFVIRRRGDGLA